MRRISLSFLPILVLAAGIVVGARAATASTTLSLVAYSTPKDAYGKIIPAFQATTAGKNVSFNQSYGASGDQARAVAAGLSADIVALSLEPDVSTLVKKGIVPSNWNQNPYHGMVTDSVVVFVVRNGNPKHIHTWADLTKSGLKHPEAKAFLKFLWSSKAQKLFGDTGYRPVLKSVASSAKYRFKQPKSLFTINSKALGLRGWKSVQYRFFDHSNGIMVRVIGH